MKKSENFRTEINRGTRVPGVLEVSRYMTLKKKMTRRGFRKPSDNLLMRLNLEGEPFWQKGAGDAVC